MQWCKKKMGSKPIISPREIDGTWAQKEFLACDGWIAHLSITSDEDVNTIVNTFETVTPASSIANCVVTEGRPGGDSGQQIVSV